MKFTALANRVQGVTMEALLDDFVGGLKPNIKRDVIAQNPVILLRCVSLAKLYEEKYSYKVRNYHTNFNHNQPASPYTYQKPNPTTNQNVSQSLKSSSLPHYYLVPPPLAKLRKCQPLKCSLGARKDSISLVMTSLLLLTDVLTNNISSFK